nr:MULTISPECIES: FAD-dependent oxidoreductase [unclassified Pseudarthrobacter]
MIARATIAGGQEEFRASTLLVATGRRAVTAGMNLETVGVKTGDRGEILVQNTLVSSNPRIWAAGDVTGAPRIGLRGRRARLHHGQRRVQRPRERRGLRHRPLSGSPAGPWPRCA